MPFYYFALYELELLLMSVVSLLLLRIKSTQWQFMESVNNTTTIHWFAFFLFMCLFIC